jgi:hypothetical protein
MESEKEVPENILKVVSFKIKSIKQRHNGNKRNLRNL